MPSFEVITDKLSQRNNMVRSKPYNSNHKSYHSLLTENLKNTSIQNKTILNNERKINILDFDQVQVQNLSSINSIKALLKLFELEKKYQSLDILEANGTYLSINFCNGLFNILEYDNEYKELLLNID
tara:strand:- start:4527 stop:4907 length:381 start_codon:yes stop_codon:yes gene_type:complete